MRALLALALVATLTGPAHADPVSAGLAIGAWWTSIGAVGQLAVQIGVGLLLTAAAAGISYLRSGGGKRAAQAQQDNTGVQIEERDGLLERRRIYGRQVVAGGVFFQKTIASTGTLDLYVLGFTLSDGVCDGLESIIVNGVECPLDGFGNPQLAPWYDTAGNYLKVSFRPGTETQPVDPIIAARWPSPPDDFYPDDADRVAKWAEFRQRGVCTVVVEMRYGADNDKHIELWGAGGIPDLKFKVRGLQVYDPRDSNADADAPATWRWSDNASLCEAGWLRSDMGFGIGSDEVEWDSFREGADLDDFWVPTLAGIERRGRVNGLVLGSEANDSVLSGMALQNRAMIRRAFGMYSIRVDRSADPACTIHQGLIVGALSYQNEPDTRAAVNRGVAQFAPARKFNQSAETFYEDGDLIAADQQVLEQRMTYRFCDSPAAAQRLLYAAVTENRVGRTLTGAFDIAILVAAGKPRGQLLEAGDVVRVWFPYYQQMNGLYTVTGLEISQDFTVSASLAGYDPAVIDGWGVDKETPFEDAA